MEWEYEAHKKQSEKYNPDIFYVDNIFTKLNDIFLKKKQYSCYKYDVHDSLVLYAVKVILQKLVDKHQGSVNASHSPPHFVFILPTSWDYMIGEELIRPLFIKSGLITQNDHHDRLLFFITLQSTFQRLQSIQLLQTSKYVDVKNQRMDLKMKNGKLYVMYGLNFTANKLLINLDLFSAHYPPVMAIGSNYVAKSTKSISFTVLLDPKMK